MKKRVLARIMSAALAAGFLMVGCGDDAPAAAADTQTEQTTEAATEETTEAATGVTFEDLQNNYAALTDAYNAVVDAYNDDSVEQSDEIDKDLADAKDLMDQMGELEETDFESQADLDAINNSMLQMCDILNAILDKMK